ncbi:pantoate--beta-alanine ligase [Maricaulis sp.]|uniref:pantoate--beta-alanine ligase n=1 Tax=unclassified Maricaulis TaxID=2632371 RepID=UPI001B034233|nr:pantoate--beta-alanine ligase [Maricaulis sp.]MBO6798125.1 pantoate--beta-alanine ligase [Maricaulis sp.]
MLTQQIPHATTLSALRTRIKSWRQDGQTVGFVPTMGALHDGHLSLVRLAKAHCDKVVASVFVNPAQFAEGEDFDAYPRAVIDDSAKLALEKCDLVYLPEREAMYPDGFASEIIVKGAAEGLESDSRPHFFNGVATVVCKLFNQVRPDVAVFGEKDYQQLQVIRQMVRDLDLGIDIIPGEIVREKDGLAMSSRNAYLSEENRARAAELNKIIFALAAELRQGEPLNAALETARASAENAFDAVDYLDVRNAKTLARFDGDTLDGPARVLATVRLGETRLLDNCAV